MPMFRIRANRTLAKSDDTGRVWRSDDEDLEFYVDADSHNAAKQLALEILGSGQQGHPWIDELSVDSSICESPTDPLCNCGAAMASIFQCPVCSEAQVITPPKAPPDGANPHHTPMKPIITMCHVCDGEMMNEHDMNCDKCNLPTCSRCYTVTRGTNRVCRLCNP